MDYPWAEHLCALAGHAAQGDDVSALAQFCEPLKLQGTKWPRAGVAAGVEKRGEE